MRPLVGKLALTIGLLLLVPLGQAAPARTLQGIIERFDEVTSYDSSVCVLHDGWIITFLSDNGSQIGAATLVEHRNASQHQNSIDAMLQRIADLVGMRSPQSITFLNEQKSALLLDWAVLDPLLGRADHVFEGSALEAMLYLKEKGFFVMHGVRENGSLVWKTAKKSGVGLRMPLTEEKLSAIEITGRQEMDEHAALVLAGKLGLRRESAGYGERSAIARRIGCREVSYMHTKRNVVLGRTNHRAAIGTKEGVEQMVRNRDYATAPLPHKSSSWPKDDEELEAATAALPRHGGKLEEELRKIEETHRPAEPRSPSILTPKEARKAYVEFIRNL